MWQCFKAAEHNELATLQKLLNQMKQFAESQNYCGQTFLHRAVIKRNIEVMKWLGSTFPHLIDRPDNVKYTSYLLQLQQIFNTFSGNN